MWRIFSNGEDKYNPRLKYFLYVLPDEILSDMLHKAYQSEKPLLK